MTDMPRHVLSLIAMLLLATVARAQDNAQLNFPGIDPDETVINAVKKAEAAYAEGDFKDAMWYYRTRVAPVGDKFAQYTIGYMYANGEGVYRDPVTAAAWFLLAAERGHEQLVEISQSALRALSADDRERARSIADELREELGDRALVRQLIYVDKANLRDQTGSRSGTCQQNGRMQLSVEGQTTQSISIQEYCRVLTDRIAAREAYLDNYVEYGDIDEAVKQPAG